MSRRIDLIIGKTNSLIIKGHEFVNRLGNFTFLAVMRTLDRSKSLSNLQGKVSMSFRIGLLIMMQHDIEKAFEFYANLGLEPKFHIKDRWAEFNVGETKIVLCPAAQELPERHTGIVLEVDNLEQIYKELVAKGINLLSEPKTAAHGVMASIKDPGNNVLDLYQPTPEKVAEIVRRAQKCCKEELGKKDDDACCKKTKG